MSITTFELIEHTDTLRFRFVYDECHETRGSYSYDTDEETKAAEDEEIAGLESGKWVVLGCIVETKCAADCPCAGCPVWIERDSLWGIVIEPDTDKLREFALSDMSYPDEKQTA